MMSDERIDLAKLRENLDHSAEPCEGACVASFERREVLALVDIAEAAQAFMACGPDCMARFDSAQPRGSVVMASQRGKAQGSGVGESRVILPWTTACGRSVEVRRDTYTRCILQAGHIGPCRAECSHPGSDA